MKNNNNESDEVYQLKITLDGLVPPIWRRIILPSDSTFDDLHRAIQCAMGWDFSHLHAFRIHSNKSDHVEIGEPNEDFGIDILPEWEEKISDWFIDPKKHSKKKRQIRYDYDFGDSWEHTIKLEKILPREKSGKYPFCVDGERACPPEDCGGVWGYADILEALENPKDPSSKEILEFFGDEVKFDPEKFDPKKIKFR